MAFPFALVVMAHLTFQDYFPVVYMYFPSQAECMSKLHALIDAKSTPRGACLRRDWMKNHGMNLLEFKGT